MLHGAPRLPRRCDAMSDRSPAIHEQRLSIISHRDVACRQQHRYASAPPTRAKVHASMTCTFGKSTWEKGPGAAGLHVLSRFGKYARARACAGSVALLSICNRAAAGAVWLSGRHFQINQPRVTPYPGVKGVGELNGLNLFRSFVRRA